MGEERGRRWLAVGLVVAAAGAGFAVWLGRDDGFDCGPLLEDRTRLMGEPFGQGSRTVAALGDSYTLGSGLSGPEAAWPAALTSRLDVSVVVDGVGSTGFTTRGFCPGDDVTYGERVDDDWIDADTVVVQGGVNDVLAGRPDDVAAAAGDLLAELEDVPTVLLVGPPNLPGADPADLRTVDDALRSAADDAGRPYLPLIGAGIELQPDLVHPTAAGQQRIADLVALALAAAGPQQ
ncbi:SGNH/GDSL hydrolase family protein [Blastococcus sp. CCUG 61487]|uniref:SGNH/GDSL hydrolase family protein n=2 Tax=Blastococcus sp. CCUG 61487 TaxID=1840703 RepID=UPI0010C08B76|nr:SGNH/GDSL hydrolase family protein [Blastococcus sp. CCUG 61487]TKJ28121.1 hypothetical protein A6V29_03170 [Blastococcus sp. CCUG 61487]